jgi:hypothetical protein
MDTLIASWLLALLVGFLVGFRFGMCYMMKQVLGFIRRNYLD